MNKNHKRERELFLVCNAHLDPVWLWEWEEGAAQALATFRAAADLAEEYGEFIFCHNEALLYQWVEQYEPELFERIKRLVQQGKWHIMGGWFLQPDCNMPSGESLIRQITYGKSYFWDHFGKAPRTAVNFDPFGHSRGLVQILKKSGYHSYLFCRPDPEDYPLPDNDFIWVGYDGSEIAAHRAPQHYNSEKGKAAEKIKTWIKRNPRRKTGLILWGIGNHGGGPSRIDLQDIRRLIAETPQPKIRHGTPEQYFDSLVKEKKKRPYYRSGLNPWAVGCYTTMAKVKQAYRKLENEFFLTEKMAAQAVLSSGMKYPRKELKTALQDMLFCQFHDILPGSSTAEVENYTLQRTGHGREILNQIRLQAFFHLLKGQPRAQNGEFPIFVYNPHPFPFSSQITCEFQPEEPNMDLSHYRSPCIRSDSGGKLYYQQEKESSNIQVDQRKRLVFTASLKPGMNRFQAELLESPEKGSHRKNPEVKENQDRIFLKSDLSEWEISKKTGWLQRYDRRGKKVLAPDGFQVEVLRDYADPWGMKVKSFHDYLGRFSLLDYKRAADFSGTDEDTLPPVRIIESGPVRTVVEALFAYQCSFLCLRYKIPARGSEFEVELRLFWNEKDRMVKLSLPAGFAGGECFGQTVCGRHRYDRRGEEWVAQKWMGIRFPKENLMLTVINDGVYGFDFYKNRLRPSLLRSAAYAAHPVEEGRPLVPQDRFEPRIDQGERIFRFWINAGPAPERSASIEREALIKNEKPMILCCYPKGKKEKTTSSMVLQGEGVVITAVKMSEENSWTIIRLFESEGREREGSLHFPDIDKKFDFKITGFEIKSLAVDFSGQKVLETDLMERPLPGKSRPLMDL